MLKEINEIDRPREKMYSKGVNSLSDEELLSILIGTGTKEMSVLDLSRVILKQLDGIKSLKMVSIDELLLIKGIKIAKAATIIAAVELGKRITEAKIKKRQKINTAADIYMILKDELEDLEQEHFLGVFLNTKGEIIKTETIFVGTINQTLIHPREIFKIAIRLNAASAIFVHNHPTGDSTPSAADYKTTEIIKRAGEIVGIAVVDHLIIGKNEFYSIINDSKSVIR